METVLKIGDALQRFVARVGKIAAWAGVALIVLTMFDVITRRFFVLGSTKLQELEWHFHTVLFMFCLGYAYVKDQHVRIDLVRERLPDRTKSWIEILGILLALIGYCLMLIYFSFPWMVQSFEQNEMSSSATGLSHRFLIKAALPAGFFLLLLAGLGVLCKRIVHLFGPPHLSAIALADRTDAPKPSASDA